MGQQCHSLVDSLETSLEGSLVIEAIEVQQVKQLLLLGHLNQEVDPDVGVETVQIINLEDRISC